MNSGEDIVPVLRLGAIVPMRDATGERLASTLGSWVLVGQPVDDSRNDGDGWSFRTRSLNPAIISSPGGTPFMVHFDDVVIPLRKSRPGPFSGTVLVGRSSSNDVQIAHRSVSKLHARIELAGPTLEDTGSSNGTTIDGAEVEPGVRRPFVSGSVIAFGSCSFQALSIADLAALLRQLKP